MVPESKTNGLVFPYERQASNGEEMPDGLSYPDQVMYLCIRMLYAQLRQGIIDRDKAIREKRKLMTEYAVYKLADETGKQSVEIIKQTEIARSEYRKNRTLENADKLLYAVEGGDHRKKVWGDTPL